MIAALRTLWRRLFSAAAEEFGEAETKVGGPLAPYNDYVEVVVPGVFWRGSWPTEETLTKLAADGVRTVASFCEERPHEQDDDVRRLGMVPLSIPVRDNTTPTAQQAAEFLDAYDRGAPIFGHCEAGKGRTGCFVALVRVCRLGWTPQRALDEAKEKGLAIPAQEDWILALPGGA